MSKTKTALTMIGLAMAGAAVAGMFVSPKKGKTDSASKVTKANAKGNPNLWV